MTTSTMLESLREGLEAKRQRLLLRPLIARVEGPDRTRPTPGDPRGLPPVFQELDLGVRTAAPSFSHGRQRVWREDPSDGTWSVRVAIDYDDLWRGREREVLEDVTGTLESQVTFLTEHQQHLLVSAPIEFLLLETPPETAELVSFRREVVGGSERVVELVVAEPPRSPDHIRHVAIIPNLIPLDRQLAALRDLEKAADDSVLGPLRALVGLSASLAPKPGPRAPTPRFAGRLDEYQRACVDKALDTPHFAVIQGPPGSGKTTVITTLIRSVLARGGRVLVVSPTNVAVDNVVEKLAPGELDPDQDDLALHSLPLRYAARRRKLLEQAARYWVGRRKQTRAGSIARRLEGGLRAHHELAERVFDHVDDQRIGHAPLTTALSDAQGVLCGTPIGLLSYEAVGRAEPGEFDLLVVDEVSKMTLPEFLAIAVKARRWVLVGDPEQLPPYNDAEENATTFQGVLDPELELVCSVGTLLERQRPERRRQLDLVVVTPEPERVQDAILDHARAVGLESLPPIRSGLSRRGRGIVVCRPDQLDEVTEEFREVRILTQRDVEVARPAVASGRRLVEARERASEVIFQKAFTAYHAQPWQARAGQKLLAVRFRHGLEKSLPSAAALAALAGDGEPDAQHAELRRQMVHQLARHYALNTVSVYDWLTGLPKGFDVSPLRELGDVVAPLAELQQAVAPFVGTLRRQYRMHASLSRVPRELFYFGEALVDGLESASTECRVRLVQVDPRGPGGETNPAEVDEICALLSRLNASGAGTEGPRQHILVITPCRKQERLLSDAVGALRLREGLEHIGVEVCTLDRCQGREAEYVFISLVRSRATVFLDAPKRWNVALTRAKEGLFLFGDLDAYLQEARRARRWVAERHWAKRPLMSLPARLLEAYDRQFNGLPLTPSRSTR